MPDDIAKEALTRAMYKLSVKTKIVAAQGHGG